LSLVTAEKYTPHENDDVSDEHTHETGGDTDGDTNGDGEEDVDCDVSENAEDGVAVVFVRTVGTVCLTVRRSVLVFWLVSVFWLIGLDVWSWRSLESFSASALEFTKLSGEDGSQFAECSCTFLGSIGWCDFLWCHLDGVTEHDFSGGGAEEGEFDAGNALDECFQPR